MGGWVLPLPIGVPAQKEARRLPSRRRTPDFPGVPRIKRGHQHRPLLGSLVGTGSPRFLQAQKLLYFCPASGLYLSSTISFSNTSKNRPAAKHPRIVFSFRVFDSSDTPGAKPKLPQLFPRMLDAINSTYRGVDDDDKENQEKNGDDDDDSDMEGEPGMYSLEWIEKFFEFKAAKKTTKRTIEQVGNVEEPKKARPPKDRAAAKKGMYAFLVWKIFPGISVWVRDLTEEGIEPNPGPVQGAVPLGNIRVVTWNMDGGPVDSEIDRKKKEDFTQIIQKYRHPHVTGNACLGGGG